MSSFLPKSIQKLIEEFSRLPGIGPKSAQRLAMHLLHSPEARVQGLAGAVGGLKDGVRFCSTCWNISEEAQCRICSDPGRNRQQICVVEEILDVVALEKTGEFKGVYHVLHGALSPVDGIGPEQLKVQALMDRVAVAVMLKSEGQEESHTSVLQSGGQSATDTLVLKSGGQEESHTSEELRTFEAESTNVGGVRAFEAESTNVGLEVIIATNPGLEGETTALYLLRLIKPFEKVRITRIARGLPVGGDLDYADEMTITKALQGRVEYV